MIRRTAAAAAAAVGADPRGESAADVVVVGAGPVGMTAAALLAAQGVRVVVLERNATTSNEPKAISLDDEALRIYQSAGMIDSVSLWGGQLPRWRRPSEGN